MPCGKSPEGGRLPFVQYIFSSVLQLCVSACMLKCLTAHKCVRVYTHEHVYWAIWFRVYVSHVGSLEQVKIREGLHISFPRLRVHIQNDC